MLAALPEPLLLLDADRRVVRANDAAEALFGERLVERDLAGALRHPAVLAATDAVLRGEGAARRRVRADEPGRAPSLGAARAAVAAGRMRALRRCCCCNDLTALKRSEQLRADFVANASHELRTPLASLVGFIETLRGPARDDRAAGERFLAIMAEQAARMTRLVDDLLSLSRIEMNEHRPPTGAVDLGVVVGSVADALEQRAHGARHAVSTLDCRRRICRRSQGDADELAQVFQNLIDNAIKYGAPGHGDRDRGAAGRSRLLPGPGRGSAARRSRWPSATTAPASRASTCRG